MKSNEFKRVAIVIGCLGCMFLLSAKAWTEDDYRIPNGTVFSCNACHYPNNTFYNDYNSFGRQWTEGLAAMDSDNDGFTNGEELLDPEGRWQEGEPDPGNPADVTNPGKSNSHPPYDTPTPTATSNVPTPTATSDIPTPTQPPQEPTSTPQPGTTFTPTPEGCQNTGVEIDMPSALFHGGDLFYCNAVVCNAEGFELSGYPLFVVLDVLGSYYFAPDFSDFNFYDRAYPEGESVVEVIGEFFWPDDTGTMDGIIWYGALTNPDMTGLFGTMDTFAFGWDS